MANFDNIIQEINTNLPDNNTQSITAAKLRTTLDDMLDAIDSAKIDYDAELSSSNIANNAITTNKINDGAVTTDKIDNGAVTTDKINDGAVSGNKLGRGYGSIVNCNDLRNMSLPFYDRAAALTGFPSLKQVNGTIITYLTSDGWITEQFIGDSWGSEDNKWKTLQANNAEETETINEILDEISSTDIFENSFEGTYTQMYGKGIIFDKLLTQGTLIKSFKFKIKFDSTKPIHIYIFTKSGDVFTVLKDFMNCGILLSGDHNFTLNYTCPSDCYIGLYNFDENINIEQSGEHTYNSYRITALNLVEGATVTISSTWGYYPKFSVECRGSFYDFSEMNEEIDQNSSEIDKLNINTAYLSKNKSVLFDRQYSFSGDTHLLTNCTLDSNNKVVSGTGDSYYLYWKRFMSDQRKCVYEIEIPSSSTPIIRVGALNTRIAANHRYSTCCEINRSTNKLIIYKGGGSNGIETLTQLVSADIVNTISSKRLLVEVERNRKITTLRVYDYYTRVYDEVSFDGNDVLFVNGAGNHRPYYFLYTNTSGIKLNTLSVFGCYDVAYVHLGDSLSESNGRCDVASTNTIGENWVEKVMNLIGWNGSIVAQSGASVADVFDALNNEVQYIKPKTVSVMIGTNHGATIQKYQDIIDWCSTRGIQLIMCNIPMTASRPSTDVNSSEYVAEELDSLNIQVVRMNNATAINGNPSNGSDLNAFANDQIHTNQLGNDRMYERFLMDAPQIIYFVR